MNQYLEIADEITCLQQDEVTDYESLIDLINLLADKFASLDPSFNKVQFLNDCELPVSEAN